MPESTMIQETLHRIRQDLAEFMGLSQIDAHDRWVELLPHRERRLLWQKLREAGHTLPDLERAPGVFWVAACAVLAPLAWLRLEAALLLLFKLGSLARWLTKPLAVHPPPGCETVYEAAVQLTPFRRAEYDSGRWSPEEIGDKVRMIFAEVSGTSFAKVTRESRILDLMDC